jgi:type I restriction enzyme S subunit
MHDLFTRGVTQDGQLRPVCEEAPKLYKESPLGWIPREWDVVSEATYLERIARLVPQTGDVIYSREGERLGIASPVDEVPVCLGQRVMLLRPSSATNAAFMLWAMNTPTFYRCVVSGLGATTSPHVNVGDIRRQLVCRPGRDEQDVIGHSLTTMQGALRTKTTEQRKLRSLKAGLMYDLLTGRVRVAVPEAQRVAADV